MGRPWLGKTKKEQKRQDYERHRQSYIDRATRHYQANRDEIKSRINGNEKKARSDPDGWPLVAINVIKTRAKKRGIKFDITAEDIVVPEWCPVLGIPIILGGKKNSHNLPSVDRINPALGYVRGNVRVISWRANALKANASIDEMRLVLADLERSRL